MHQTIANGILKIQWIFAKLVSTSQMHWTWGTNQIDPSLQILVKDNDNDKYQ
jgi:hypothetical protein